MISVIMQYASWAIEPLAVSCIVVSDGSAGCDIVDDRINGKALHLPVKLLRR